MSIASSCASRALLFALSLAPLIAQEPHHFKGLGGLHWKVNTASAEAQAYFDQGLAFLYAFNHEEAIRSFEEATRLDPNCAMAWWGLATAQGPHINRPGMDETRAKAGFEAARKAASLSATTSAPDKRLIDAAGIRFSVPNADDWPARDRAYSEAMRRAWEQQRGDAQVGVLLVESLLLLHPWSPWDGKGHPQTETLEAAEVLDEVLLRHPNHPQALHLSIHLWEMSPTPARALPMANRLRHLQPGLGHMTHMPSHIDVLLGHWQLAVEANEAAIRADESYLKVRQASGLQPGYMAHNHHMLGFAAMMSGQSAKAIAAMDSIVEVIPPETLKTMAVRMDWYLAMPFEARKRFGKWEELLALPEPFETFPIARALRHADRGVALTALGRLSEARDEEQKFKASLGAVPDDALIKRDRAKDALAVAQFLLEGELLLAEGKVHEGLRSLRSGVEAEDALKYHEPPTWIQPLRQALGAALLRAAQPGEALAAFDADLARWPHNVWSLQGRWQALKSLARKREAVAAKRQFDVASQRADLPITTACLCQPFKEP